MTNISALPANAMFSTLLNNNHSVLRALLNAVQLPRYASTDDAIEVLKARLMADYSDACRKNDIYFCGGKFYLSTSLRLRENPPEPVWLVLTREYTGRWLLNYSRQNHVPAGIAARVGGTAIRQADIRKTVPLVKARPLSNNMAATLSRKGWTVAGEIDPKNLTQLFPTSTEIAEMTTFAAGSDIVHGLRLAATYPGTVQSVNVRDCTPIELRRIDGLLRTLVQQGYIVLEPSAARDRRFRVSRDSTVQDYLKGRWAEIYVAAQLLDLIGHDSSWQVRMDVQLRNGVTKAEADLLFYNRNSSQLFYIECKSGRAYLANHDSSALLAKAQCYGIPASNFAVFSSETSTLSAGMERLCTHLTTFNVRKLRKGLEAMIRKGAGPR